MGASFRRPGAVLLTESANKKLSPVIKVPYNGPAKAKFPYRPQPIAPFCASTYVSIAATCPNSCRFKRAEDGTPGGCYVDAGKTVFTIRRLDRESEHLTGDDVICAEADLLDSTWVRGVPDRRDLRLHVGGDTSSAGATLFLAQAAARWQLRGGGKVWTFTHRWQEIHRRAWGSISVLASVEDASQFAAARRMGYAPAIVVPKHHTARAQHMGGLLVIPCPAETRGKTCVECRLCLDSSMLFERGAAISFSLHGIHKPQALVRLGLRGTQRRLL